jgi:ribosome-associated protein YbcJ (S4-like RNA binding protein)
MAVDGQVAVGGANRPLVRVDAVGVNEEIGPRRGRAFMVGDIIR